MYEYYEMLKAELCRNADAKYDEFNAKIVNSEYPTIGVRIPVIRKIAKSVPIEKRQDVIDGFFADTELTYEAVMLVGMIAARKGDYAVTREYLKRMIPLFGSWAHTDCVIPCLKWVDADEFLRDFSYLLDCKGQYEVRAYIIFLFDCLTDERIGFVLDTLRSVRYGDYYVDMAAAWLLAECLVKFYDKTLPLFTERTFSVFVHNKAIQKARESYRIAPDIKAYLNSLKCKA
ncbi:MAG: DNA alkylation repair protein [Clostridiales bacterium]|nr:DNA alkylation repair protein [Clostridiales bacterium]